MRRIMSQLLLIGLLLAFHQDVRAQDEPRAIIEKAVQAHGGAANLTKFKAHRTQAKGSIIINGAETPFTAQTAIQLPSQFRNEMHFRLPNMELVAIQVLNGDNAWISMNGKTEVPTDKVQADMREILHMDEVVRLVPLLKNADYKLTSLGESKVNDKPAVGVQVALKGYKDVRLFFDKVTGLLVKTEHPVLKDAVNEVNQEELYSDFKDVDGIMRPMKVTVHREGKKTMEGELTEIKHLDKLDESVFAKPDK